MRSVPATPEEFTKLTNDNWTSPKILAFCVDVGIARIDSIGGQMPKNAEFWDIEGRLLKISAKGYIT